MSIDKELKTLNSAQVNEIFLKFTKGKVFVVNFVQ